MKNLYCLISDKYRKFKNPKLSYIFQKKVLSSMRSKYKSED